MTTLRRKTTLDCVREWVLFSHLRVERTCTDASSQDSDPQKRGRPFGLRKLERGQTADSRNQAKSKDASAAEVAGTKTNNSLINSEQ
jgi:hypothetical protein